MENTRLRVGIEGTIVAALAIVLSMLPTNIGTGFTVSLGMIPMILYAFRRGTAAGIAAGFLWGILHYLVGNVSILNLVQGFIEYFVAFMFTGFAGLFAQPIQQAIQKKASIQLIGYIILGTITGTLARFFWHFVAGYYFWGSYAPEGMNPLWYSFIANGGSALATILVTTIALLLLSKTAPLLFIPKDTKQ
ncbi:energy-coupled thiamine transporter ThiT [Carnobacterium mobile]|uniref:energy-coupled thiamine transporter ThiT n=1 Tax=Carnobacterium mobile TaxID=2750 RepID=UPI0005500102|nr:energy-coupled thiamine transporter ThiT [Carnobacterium mobile]